MRIVAVEEHFTFPDPLGRIDLATFDPRFPNRARLRDRSRKVGGGTREWKCSGGRSCFDRI
jgi:hypothetical protein